jgi:DNA invertase Pin-like site-specific DNA recombinase
VRDLLDIVGELTAKGVTVSFLHPSLSFSGADSPINKLLFLLLAGFAEMERALIKERQLEGIAIAKREKRYLGRAPAIRANNGKQSEMEAGLAEGLGVAALARRVGVSRQTVYSWLKDRKQTAEVAA